METERGHGRIEATDRYKICGIALVHTGWKVGGVSRHREPRDLQDIDWGGSGDGVAARTCVESGDFAGREIVGVHDRGRAGRKAKSELRGANAGRRSPGETDQARAGPS